jgi:hypothetical protein
VEDDFDDDDVADTPVLTAPKKGNKWLVIGAFFELISDILKTFAKFFDTITDESLAKFRYERNKQDFMIQASREIEMLTSGEYDAASTAASGSQRTRGSLEED